MGIVKNRCVIIGGGDCSAEFIVNNITEYDYIICADSGYDYLCDTNILPDIVIGDFDSVKEIPNIKNLIQLPIEKDVTDCGAAFDEGMKKGFKNFLLLGGTGGRFEHTFANIIIMANATVNNINFEILDEKHHFYCIHNSKTEIKKNINEQISVFAFGGIAQGVSEKGFHYELNNYILSPFNHIGISNDVVKEKGIISVDDGTLIIVKTKM